MSAPYRIESPMGNIVKDIKSYDEAVKLFATMHADGCLTIGDTLENDLRAIVREVDESGIVEYNNR